MNYFSVISLFILGATSSLPAHAEESLPTGAPLASFAMLEKQESDRVLGNENAPVTIVEYSSLSCPHCAQFHTDTLPEIEKKYVDTGKVRFLVRPFPLNESALRGAMLTMCVPKDKYYSFLKVLFSMQSKWALSLDYRESLKRIALVGGVSEKQFETCMSDKSLEDSLIKHRADATETLKIDATPTFFVNGEKLKGDVSVKEFSEVIDKHLAKE